MTLSSSPGDEAPSSPMKPAIGTRVTVRPHLIFGGAQAWIGTVVATAGEHLLVVRDDEEGIEYTVPVQYVVRLN